MGPAALPTRAFGLRRTGVRAPVMMPRATGLSRLSLRLLAATTSAGTAAHRIVHRTDASNPFTFQEAYAEAAAWAPDPVQPGETRREVRTRVDESAKCLADSEIVPGPASPCGSVGRSRRHRASNAPGPLATAADPDELAAGRLGGHLATEGTRYLFRHRGAVCRADGASARGTKPRGSRPIVKTHAACRTGLRVVRAIATEGAQGRARITRLPTRLGAVEASGDRRDLARNVRHGAGSRGEIGACERVRPGVACEEADPDELAVKPTLRIIPVAAGRSQGASASGELRRWRWLTASRRAFPASNDGTLDAAMATDSPVRGLRPRRARRGRVENAPNPLTVTVSPRAGASVMALGTALGAARAAALDGEVRAATWFTMSDLSLALLVLVERRPASVRPGAAVAAVRQQGRIRFGRSIGRRVNGAPRLQRLRPFSRAIACSPEGPRAGRRTGPAGASRARRGTWCSLRAGERRRGVPATSSANVR